MNKNVCFVSAIHQCEKDIPNSVLCGIPKDSVTVSTVVNMVRTVFRVLDMR